MPVIVRTVKEEEFSGSRTEQNEFFLYGPELLSADRVMALYQQWKQESGQDAWLVTIQNADSRQLRAEKNLEDFRHCFEKALEADTLHEGTVEEKRQCCAWSLDYALNVLRNWDVSAIPTQKGNG